ncbi:uncharacterized protein B0I36DRAFT_336321 [Microdochium trichocladiopsis]|uniref:PD-(D/E)XK nuclease-like domain-containing protein n=1 Tax=Microdochium trichocladiopsis TaxID=1682393 RepID=A0A9P8XSM8_9PEZI|nr:uncharacterized protein B0I36DRAFT_336321 [Microdochium trichocladiopsis]KAH7016006.1 hypothetical protein B0I36DRAFT_336321 [Microdochium trichocladiopsis]
MDELESDIEQWLKSLPHQDLNRSSGSQRQPGQQLSSSKRPLGLMSPPTSQPTSRGSSPSKRPRPSNDTPEEATPRPTRSHRLAINHSRASSMSARSESSASSSPSKQLAQLRIIPAELGGAEVCDIDVEDERLPDALADLILALQAKSPLVSPSARNDIQAHYEGTRATRQWRDPALYGSERSAIGPTPQPDFVDHIVRQARECSEGMFDEQAWASMVYYPLLYKAVSAIQPGRWMDTTSPTADELADLLVVPCSTASIVPQCRKPGTPFKKVDFAIAYRPQDKHRDSETPAESSRYEQLKRFMLASASPELSLNHTSYPGLRDKPIVLSVEVKRTGDGADAAKLQLLTWLSAQWLKIDELCALASSPGMQKPAYLLALLIQGHDWNLVACSRCAVTQKVVRLIDKSVSVI